MTEKNIIQYNKNEEPIIISKPTSDKLLRLEHPSDAMALYWFYYYTAKWQYSNTVYANNHYTKTGLKWTDQRLSRAKKDLIKLELIEQRSGQWDPKTKKIGCPAIKINFVWWDKKKIQAHNQETLPPQISRGVGTLHTRNSYTLGKQGIKYSTVRLKGSTNRLKHNHIPAADAAVVCDEPQDYFSRAARMLAKIVAMRHEVKITTRKVKSWAAEMQKMVRTDCIVTERITAALRWYAEHHAEQYVPVIECGRSLRDKFIRLEAAMKRADEPPASAAPTRQAAHTAPLPEFGDPTNSLEKTLLAAGQQPKDIDQEKIHSLSPAGAERQLLALLTGLGVSVTDPAYVRRFVAEALAWHDGLYALALKKKKPPDPTIVYPDFIDTTNIDRDDTHPIRRFLKRRHLWERLLGFIEEKQHSFPLRSIHDLRVGNTRWHEFLQRLANDLDCDMVTAERLTR